METLLWWTGLKIICLDLMEAYIQGRQTDSELGKNYYLIWYCLLPTPAFFWWWWAALNLWYDIYYLPTFNNLYPRHLVIPLEGRRYSDRLYILFPVTTNGSFKRNIHASLPPASEQKLWLAPQHALLLAACYGASYKISAAAASNWLALA